MGGSQPWEIQPAGSGLRDLACGIWVSGSGLPLIVSSCTHQVSQKSPFIPVKVNKAKERQQIIDWARKRQGHARMAEEAAVKHEEKQD